MMRILHFADAHIDMANQHGRRDPSSGLPLRVQDFLKSLDTIVDTAIEEKVNLVIFAGDAYRDRTPVPTFQREWGRRMLRLSQAGIPTLLLVGNHDLSPAAGRAHALQEYDTLQVPHITVLDRPRLLRPVELGGLPLQVIALPWVTRSGLMASLSLQTNQGEKVLEALEERLTMLLQQWLGELDPSIPAVLTAHATIQGAMYGNERSVMLGSDLVLPASLVKDARLDYVALGHIHRFQDLNSGSHPPVIYPGSIERVDFGEAADEKYFVVAEVERDHTRVIPHKLAGRKFFDRQISLKSGERVMEQIKAVLPSLAEMTDSMLRLTIEYPRAMEPLLDENELRLYTAPAFEFHLSRRPIVEGRARLQLDGQVISSLSSLDLLEKFWQSTNTPPADMADLQNLAHEIIHDQPPEI